MNSISETSESLRPKLKGFPDVPWSWYYGGSLGELAHGPKKVTVGAKEFVVYRSESGQVATLSGRCIHMGADLSLGCVAGENLRCPFHAWEFGQDGRCVHIPAGSEIPPFAKQGAFPTRICGNHVFFFNHHEALFDLPFFDGKSPEELLPARPFDLSANLPWHMVAANGFDIQHFRAAHDRTLLDEPVVEDHAPFARRISARFGVTGNGIRDRLTRAFSGPEVKMTVTSWSGTMILVTAEFSRTTSYGMVCVTPIDATHCHLRTIVWVPRSRGKVGRWLFDPLDAVIRRSFIRAFVRSDEWRSEGIRYTPGTLIDADAALAGYFGWLGETVRGESQFMGKGG